MDPPTKIRITIIALIFSFFLIGIPVWYKTTQVYRATLPEERLSELSNTPLNLSFKLCFFINLLSVKDLSYSELQSSFELHKTAQIAMHSFEFNNQNTKSMNGKYDINLECIDKDQSSRASITIQNTRSISVVISGLCTADILSRTIVSLVSNMFTTELLSYNYEHETASFIRTMKYAPEYNVIFSLLLEDPSKQRVQWDMNTAIESYLLPFKEMMAPISELRLSAQVVNHAPLFVKPVTRMMNGSSVHVVKNEDTSLFINLAGWNLAKFTSVAPPIRFILYVPAPHQNPLFLSKVDGSIQPSNAFNVPRWGGLLIFNPTLNESDYKLNDVQVQSSMEVFISQLRGLLGIEMIKLDSQMQFPVETSIKYIRSPDIGITDFEFDRMQRRRISETLKDARTTLISLTNLIASLENMMLPDTIVERVSLALTHIETATRFIAESNIEQAWVNAKEAYILSDSAFFDPTMLALLYFPDEHKYAIYMPLFVPMLLPILSAIFKEFKRYRESRRAKVTKIE